MMTDYHDEQCSQLEALEPIYPNSFTALSENPPNFTITVTSKAAESDEIVQTTDKFTYRGKYPDEGPCHNLDTTDIQFLEDAGNNVELDESLFQETDALELEDGEDDTEYYPAEPENDLTD
uniref:RWD domain-containing protein n=1 Tax=Molossus molossus TaxID=27622 RepID=A0A7J8J159_MOLMO|nr:hypothetical protein HJG59_010284 [Molossus molossus]